MTHSRRSLTGMGALALFVATLCSAPAAFATNGLFSHGYGAKSNALAGGGSALPQDALASASNPAGMVHVGDRKDIGLAIFSPLRSYDVDAPAAFVGFDAFPPLTTGVFDGGPDVVDSGSNYFLIPNFGWNKMLDANSSVGVAVYGNGGMNTDYNAADTPFGLGAFGAGVVPGALATTGINYSQLFINTSYSRKLSDTLSWGVSGILNYSRIKVEGLRGFSPFSLNPAALSDVGYDSDFGIGGKIGIQGSPAAGVTLAASYQTKIGNTFDDYAGLFANSGELDIPATATIGAAFDAGKGTVTLDVQKIFYEGSDSISNTSSSIATACIPSFPFTPFPTAAGAGCLGGSSGVGFGWEDMTVVKLGYQWPTGNGYTWRVGASAGDQPIPESEVTFNIIAPAVIENHFTAGFTREMDNGRELSMAVMYAPENCVTGPDLFSGRMPPLGISKTVELCMHQFQIEAGYSW